MKKEINKKLFKTLKLIPTFILGSFLIAGILGLILYSGDSISQYNYNENFQKGMMAIGAGICAIGMIGTGFGQGIAAGKAAEAVSRNPEAEAKIRTMFIVGAAIAESSALYSLVIAIIILFVV